MSVETTIGVILGLFSGFLALIAFDLYKEQREKGRLKDLIKQELTRIRKEIELNLKKTEEDVIPGKSYRKSVFNALTVDILRRFDVETSARIEITYANKIGSLGAGVTRKRCKEVLNYIDDTLKMLDP